MIGWGYLDQKIDRVWIIEAVQKLCDFYMEELGNPAGGTLHIVLADGNTSDEDVRFCLGEAEKAEDHVGVALAKCLLELTEEERDEIYERLYPDTRSTGDIIADASAITGVPLVAHGTAITITSTNPETRKTITSLATLRDKHQEKP